MVLEFIIQWVVDAISYTGYLGVFLFMALESALIPIPSEVIMPFSGYLVFAGRFGFWEVVLAGALGNLVGSWVAYWAGAKGGRHIVLRFHGQRGMEHLKVAEKWFERYGDVTAFFSRLMPVVRTFISFPAGVGKMNFKRFSIYTFVGSFIWSAVLTYIGFVLGNRWEEIMGFFRQFEVAIILVLIVAAIYWFKGNNKKANKNPFHRKPR
ncbi:MAG TPA: DedA family protein [archaeon]|nr:DedA family protein [archaeon]